MKSKVEQQGIMDSKDTLSRVNRIRIICLQIPELKRIVVEKSFFDGLAFELQQIQRFGVNGFNPTHLMQPIMLDGIEIWHDKQEIAPND